MLFWRGLGVITVVLFGAAVGIIGFLHGPLSIQNRYLSNGILIAAGALNWFIGRNANSELENEPSQRHSLFWIPMEWWTVVFVVWAGIGFVFWAGPR